MMLDDVIEIKKAAPDSHFKLLPCKCSSDNVAYVHYNGRGGAAWRVQCFDCGYTVDKGNKVRHDAQVNWNKKVKKMKRRRIADISIGHRAYEEVLRLFPKMKDAERIIGCEAYTIYKWKDGVSPSAIYLTRLLELGADIRWILTGKKVNI